MNLAVSAVGLSHLDAPGDTRARQPVAAVTSHPTVARPQPADPPDNVAGRVIPSAEVRTVGDALARAHVVPRDGRLLAVVDHRVLDAHAFPAVILLDERRVSLSTPVPAGSHIRVVPSRDRIEDTRKLRQLTPADPSGTGLYVGGRSGLVIKTVGVHSGQVLHRRVVRTMQHGHLRHHGAVALTFDDGPGPTYTKEILDLLAQHDVKAVFCQIGRQAKAHHKLVHKVVAGGHLLCDHTMNHDENLASDSDARLHNEIHDAKVAITKASGGEKPVFFRAPGGNWSDRVEREARRENLTPLKWTVDPRDWTHPGTQMIVDNVLRNVRPGSVILLHDGGGDRTQTVRALRQLLVQLPELGYHFTLPAP